MDAMVGLVAADAAATHTIQIIPCLLKTKLKGPVVRCVAVNQNPHESFEVGNVDSVDKVFRILSKHMKVKVSLTFPHVNYCLYESSLMF